ncbi:MAG: hypothetical protein WKG00_03350 [Polyangiaceae bacterium]
MSHFARIRANLAAWALGSTVSSAEFDALDVGRFKSINGDDGGTWAPTAAIVVGGAGVNVTGPSEFTNVETFHLKGAMTAFSGAEVNLNSGSVVTGSVGSVVTLNGATTVKQLTVGPSGAFIFATDSVGTLAGTAYIALTGSAHIDVETGTKIVLKNGGALEAVAGSSLLIDSAVFASAGSNWSLDGPIVLTGSLTLNDNTKSFSWARKLSFASSSVGSIVRRYATLADANATIDVSKDHYVLPKTAGASRTYVLRHSTSPVPSNGQEIEVSRRQPTAAHTIRFEREDGTYIASLQQTVSTQVQTLKFVYFSTAGGWIAAEGSGQDFSVYDLGGTYT